MRQYILKRLLLMPITLIGITFLVFFLTRMVPGGPVERMLQEQSIGALSGEKTVGQMNGRLGNDDMERLEELFNLQEPLWKAYLQWLGVSQEGSFLSHRCRRQPLSPRRSLHRGAGLL